jgi:peptidyl-prolyl cis-trans isomerase SurA
VRLRGLALGLVGLAVAGCAVPGWVPVLGRSRPPAPVVAAPPPAPPPAAARAPRPAPPADADEIADRIVAVVNNDAITLGEVQEAIALHRQENRGRALESDEALFTQLLARLIDARLQLQEAEREKITVEDAEVEEEIAERMKRFGARTREELEAMVRAQGLSFEAVRRRVRDSLRVQKLVRRKVALRVSVTEDEIDRYLAENRDKLETGLTYHARHILIVPETDTDAGWEAARIRAEIIRGQLAAGADFAELARRHSRDATAPEGGDLGALKRGELAPEVEQRILALEPGQTSEPVRTSLGWHLFRLESREALEGERLRRLRQQVRDILYRQKYEARLEAWLREIKARAIIEVRM